MKLVILGLSITSSWGNGHATTFRALLKGMAAHGHEVVFLERDVAWYAANRDLPAPPFCTTFLYGDLAELKERFTALVAGADAVIVGSYVPDGIEVATWVSATARGITAFYDIDTPVTLAALERGACAYLAPGLIPGFDLYLSFTGGPVLERLEKIWGARAARPLYCSVDTDAYRPTDRQPRLALGYLGTYSPDRQPGLDSLFLEPARRCPELRFAMAGPQYPKDIAWPANVERIEHLPPAAHPDFYGAQRFTLNVTRTAMRAAGHAPSVRLFEAAACGVPVISDRWPGIEEFFRPDEEILLAHRPEEVVAVLRELSGERRRAIGAAARQRVLRAHGAEARARELETWLEEARRARPRTGRPAA